MYQDLFEHETLANRDAFRKLWDTIPGTITCAEMEQLFLARVRAAGYDCDRAEAFLHGDPSC